MLGDDISHGEEKTSSDEDFTVQRNKYYFGKEDCDGTQCEGS